MFGQVRATSRLTPGMVRVELDGDGLAGFDRGPWTDAYLKVWFPGPDFRLPVPFDVAAIKALPAGARPAARRITVRDWDPVDAVLTLDFVVHGASGAAGPWAANAQPGDLLQLDGPSGSYAPDPTADWHLLIGDSSALPAISASLAAIPAGAPVLVLAEVDSADHELPLQTPGALSVQWVHRDGGHPDPELLLHRLLALPRPGGRVHAFVHGEAVGNRALRKHLLGEWALPRADLSVSPYWRRGHTDESWREIKPAWSAEVETDC